LVYGLYELTEEMIRIVEGMQFRPAVLIARQTGQPERDINLLD
jgi:hypothetical protein